MLPPIQKGREAGKQLITITYKGRMISPRRKQDVREGFQKEESLRLYQFLSCTPSRMVECTREQGDPKL
jgi:hypothetical protein